MMLPGPLHLEKHGDKLLLMFGISIVAEIREPLYAQALARAPSLVLAAEVACRELEKLTGELAADSETLRFVILALRGALKEPTKPARETSALE